MTGATGAIFGIRLLERLRGIADVETHLIMSRWARLNISAETDYTPAQVQSLAHVTYNEGDQGAAISSGSFRVDAMVVVPCSMRTLAAIRHGLADNLVARAADVVLKERRNLCLVPRETPLNAIHLDNMLALAQIGVGICPPMPAFYNRPTTLDDLVDHITVRVLDQLGLNIDYPKRWAGLSHNNGRSEDEGNHKCEQPSSDATLMWEALSDNASAELQKWARTELLGQLRDVDPSAEVNLYHNNTGRVVLIATGNVAAFQPPAPPEHLIRREPHSWRFDRAPLR
ncbi:UbiX family flavin prenyltransferase [Mycobacterium interjectum]|nr:UbiX family flavin prenyltransferase [Mycobacterium interjectum]